MTEDWRKGWEREVIGIIPVVTTAANALYAQSYIDLSGNLSDVNHFETLCGDSFIALNATDAEGQTLSIDGNVMNNTSGLMSVDLVTRIACDSYFSNISRISVNVLSVNEKT